MKKQIFILNLGLLLASSQLSFAQENIQPCNTYAAMEEHFAADPKAKAKYDESQKQFQIEYLERVKNNATNKTAMVTVTVPVVFHILHQGGPENISDAQCIAALKQVNEDFARLGADTSSIFTPFKSLYINCDIKFMLARKDTNGNCINGIVRHIDPKTNWSQAIANQGNASGTNYWAYTWNPTRYLNIYVVANIVPQGTVTGNGVIVGYTYRPGTWPTRNLHDAVVYRYNYLGAGAAGGYNARLLSHEFGHWLGLAHTFGNTNNPGVVCGSASFGDGIADTPDTKGNFSSCPASSTNSNILCTSGAAVYYQNVQNFMDYSSCARNFTKGQAEAMQNALASSISGRVNVGSASNLGASFTNVSSLGICAPIAEFLSASGSYTICQGGVLPLKDYSYNGNIISYQWIGGSGVVFSAATTSVTNATFNTLGPVNVTLTVSNAQGNSSKVRTIMVVNGDASITGPYSESFEGASVPANWNVSSTPPNAIGWQETADAAYHQAKSFFVDGSTAAGGMETFLQMPIIDLLNNQGSGFTFAYAYARKSSTHNDNFKVQFSKDCGGSWTDVVTKSAQSMASVSGGVQAEPFIPSGDDQWDVIDVAADYAGWFNFSNSASVLIRFSFEEAPAGSGNNFFLDAVNFSVLAGINALTKSIKLNLYPNPTTGETNLNFTLNNAATVKMLVVDLLGKEMTAPYSYQMAAGEQSLPVNKDARLAKGIYFVNLTVDGAKMSRKLIVH